MENKTCKKCNINKSLSEFYFRKSQNSFGGACKECEKAHNVKYLENNKLKKIEKSEKNKKWKENNPDYQKKYLKEYKDTNKEQIKKQRREYAELNKDKIREYDKNYRREKMKADPFYKLSKTIRNLIGRAFKRKDTKKQNKTTDILGCTFEEFRLYLESKFESWMNWNNYGSYRVGKLDTWQIDHIIPTSSAQTEGDIIKLNHYTNLQPLNSKENLDKRDIY